VPNPFFLDSPSLWRLGSLSSSSGLLFFVTYKAPPLAVHFRFFESRAPEVLMRVGPLVPPSSLQEPFLLCFDHRLFLPFPTEFFPPSVLGRL